MTKTPMTHLITCLLAVSSLTFCGLAQAQKAGTFSVSVGVTHIAPAVDSGTLSAPSLPNTQVDVNSNSRITGSLNYMLTDQIALYLPLGLGFRHEVSGAGAIAGVGKLAETQALPITLIGQYRFLDADARLRPYIGAGPSYVKFYQERGTGVLTALTDPGGPGTSVSFESRLAPTLQLGASYSFSERLYVDASYSKTFLETRATLSTGQTIDVKLNPSALTLQAGCRF